MLMVVSPSTKKYSHDYEFDELMIVSNPPNKDTLKGENTYCNAIAIGGGSVIDTAKILCKNKILAIPTTYAGACSTSHAVYWDNGEKYDVKCKLPEIGTLWENPVLPKEVEVASRIDCLCHLIESLISPKATEKSNELVLEAVDYIRYGDWLYASILAGQAIEITGTNIIHGMSYPLTAKYSIPHGVSLAHILELAMKYKKVSDML